MKRTLFLPIPLILSSLLIGSLEGVNSPSAYSGIYEAECLIPRFDGPPRGGRVDPRRKRQKCKDKIVVSAEAITTPYGSIPISRVTSWGIAGESSTAVGTGVATTILLGPIGLLGFLSKKHDYTFAVNGYNFEGDRKSITFQFKDGKQPKRLTTEMTMLTGLSMGQKRSLKEIRKLEASGGSLEPENIGSMNSVDYSPDGKYPESLYQGPNDSDKQKCLFGWCRK